jgi:hypothetical protein
MTRYVWLDGGWTDTTGWKRAPRRTPYIIRDVMDAVQHPATGQTLDSKSRFREVTRAHGLEEVGNDVPIRRHPRPTSARQDIADAYDMIEQGHTPAPVERADGETRIYEATQ